MRNKQLVDEIRHVVPLTLEIDEPHSADAANLAKIYELLWGRTHPESKIGTPVPMSPADHLEEARIQIRMAEKLLLGDEREEPAESLEVTALRDSWGSILTCMRAWNRHAQRVMDRVEIVDLQDDVLSVRVVPPYLMQESHRDLLAHAIETVTGMELMVEVREGADPATLVEAS